MPFGFAGASGLGFVREQFQEDFGHHCERRSNEEDPFRIHRGIFALLADQGDVVRRCEKKDQFALTVAFARFNPRNRRCVDSFAAWGRLAIVFPGWRVRAIFCGNLRQTGCHTRSHFGIRDKDRLRRTRKTVEIRAKNQ